MVFLSALVIFAAIMLAVVGVRAIDKADAIEDVNDRSQRKGIAAVGLLAAFALCVLFRYLSS